jgi:hypothetical protein
VRVHIVIRFLDIGTILLALCVLVLLRRRWMLVVGVGVECLLVMGLYLHSHYGVSWTVLGKVGVNAVIPLVMALVGNYLAAEIEDSITEKRLWRAPFCAVALLGIVGSLFVEIQLEREHKTENRELRGGIREDFREDLADVIVTFNKTNVPKNRITGEQFKGLAEIADGTAGAPAPPVIPRTAHFAYPLVTDYMNILGTDNSIASIELTAYVHDWPTTHDDLLRGRLSLESLFHLNLNVFRVTALTGPQSSMSIRVLSIDNPAEWNNGDASTKPSGLIALDREYTVFTYQGGRDRQTGADI